MNGSEFLDLSLRAYQTMGWTILKITIVPSLFCLAAMTFFFRYVLPSYGVTNTPDSTAGQLMEAASTTGLALFIATPLFLVGLSYNSIVATKLVSDFMVGNAPSAESADSAGRQRLMSLFWLNARQLFYATGGILISFGLLALSAYISDVTAETNLTAGVVVGIAWIGFIAGVVMFLMIVSVHALAPQVMILEDVPPGVASKRSKQLLKAYGHHGAGHGSVWALYSLLFLLFLFIAGGISGSLDTLGFPDNVRNLIAGWPFSPVIVEALGLLPTFFVIWTLMPLWAIATTIIYYDRRIRLEGYDIEALAEDVWRADRSRRFEL